MKISRTSLLLCSVFALTACHKSEEKKSLELRDDSVAFDGRMTTEKWKLPELTQIEKQDLVKSVKTVFNDFYVNRMQKLDEYNYDALEEANKLEESMNSEDLLKSTMNIFSNIRDLHTGFIYPLPARCLIGGFPLTAALSYNDTHDVNGDSEKLIISSKLDQKLNPQFAKKSEIENYNAIQAGDEIISITNLGLEGARSGEIYAKEAIYILGKISRGANKDAYKTRAVQKFFSRSGRYTKIPEGQFTLKIKKHSDGQIVKYSFPWMTYQSSEPICINSGVQASRNLKRIQENNVFNLNNNLFINKNSKDLQEEFVKDFYSSFSDNKLNIKTKIILQNGKQFAFVRINAFIPMGNETAKNYLEAREKIDSEVNVLRNFITDNKNIIEGVIFDVRGNGGGYGSFPQLIANAFTSKFVENMTVQPLVSQTNRDTFNNLELSRYYSRIGTLEPLDNPMLDTVENMDMYLNNYLFKDAITKRKLLLKPADRYDGDENDALPSYYNKDKTPILKPVLIDKPIAVLTNSNCFSACDIFVSLFKDYKIGRIFGETKHTGGGGANVIEWKDFLIPVVIDEKGTKSSIIPNGRNLPRGSEIRFAWNKIIREKALNKNEEYIEGIGVIADYIYKQTAEDILNDDKVIIGKILNDMSDEKNSKEFYLNR